MHRLRDKIMHGRKRIDCGQAERIPSSARQTSLHQGEIG